MIKKIWLRWLYRNKAKDSLADSYLILLKSARRCAYDLRHAVDMVPRGWHKELFHDRATHWLELFTPTGVKDYRLELHEKINELERKVEQLQGTLKRHGIDSETSSGKPF